MGWGNIFSQTYEYRCSYDTYKWIFLKVAEASIPISGAAYIA